MQMILQSFLAILMILLSTKIYAKNTNAVDLNRLRLKNLYRNQILIRPVMNNHTRTTVALGLGIIEVAGIDPQKQVCSKLLVFISLIRSIAGHHIECQSRIKMV